jgi:uncharacterized protein YegJ (DUF2314 family)
MGLYLAVSEHRDAVRNRKGLMMDGIFRALACGALAILLLGIADARQTPALAGDPVILYSDSDPEMNEAIDAARATLDGFLEFYFSPDFNADGGALKVAIPTPDGGAEHIFVSRIERKGPTAFEGSIDNEPHNLPSLRLGDRYQFSRDQISDWNYWKDQKLHGSYTLRAMLPRLPKAQADAYGAMLAPLP